MEPHGALEAAQARRVDAGRTARRALLESIAHRAIAALDAMDTDPEAEECGDEDEATLQPATLAANRVPLRRVHAARGFREPGAPSVPAPHFPSRPTPNRPPRRKPASLADLFGIVPGVSPGVLEWVA